MARRTALVTRTLYGPEHVQWETAVLLADLEPVTLYVDGSCPESSRRPGEAPMGAGVVLLRGAAMREWSIPLGGGTNQAAEIHAIRYGLAKIVDREKEERRGIAVKVISDSQYAIGSVSMPWKAKANKELIRVTRALVAAFPEIEFEHVDGHIGVEGNERADVLAGQAVAGGRAWRAYYEGGVLIEEQTREQITDPFATPGTGR